MSKIAAAALIGHGCENIEPIVRILMSEVSKYSRFMRMKLFSTGSEIVCLYVAE